MRGKNEPFGRAADNKKIGESEEQNKPNNQSETRGIERLQQIDPFNGDDAGRVSTDLSARDRRIMVLERRAVFEIGQCRKRGFFHDLGADKQGSFIKVEVTAM